MTLRGACTMAELFLCIYFLSTIKGEPQLIGSSQPVGGLVGDDVILPCSLQPAESVTEKTVEWTRSDLNPSSVYIFREGHFLYEVQHPSFQHRTSLFQQELKNGNMSLKLTRLLLSDKGTYTCKLATPELQTSIQVHLVVGAVSEPEISAVRYDGSKLSLKCEAKKWYPRPEMEWRDKEGSIIIPDETSTEHDEYYSVNSSITVAIAPNDIYTCTVRQQNITQSRTTNYTVPDVYKEVFSLKYSKSAVEGLFGVSLMVIFALILSIVLYINASKIQQRFQCMRRTASVDETDGLTMEHLKSKIQNLQEQVERLQREKEQLLRRLEETEKFQRQKRGRKRLTW